MSRGRVLTLALVCVVGVVALAAISYLGRLGFQDDTPVVRVSRERFERKVYAEGYLKASTLELDPGERASLALGLERVSLELAARFATDALCESYFGWDPERFPSAGEHDRVRARGQLSLYHQARRTRGERLAALDAAP